MDAPAPPPPQSDSFPLEPEFGWQRGLLNAFILFHLFAIMIWNMPGSYVQREMRARITKYMSYIGLDQAWGMFAPEPGRENFYIQARITLADGQKLYRPIGRQDNLNPFSRLIHERERKLTENMYNPGNGMPYYRQMSLWALRGIRTDPKNPPVKVELMRHWSVIPPLPEGVHKSPLTGWRTDIVLTTDLTKAKGKGTAR